MGGAPPPPLDVAPQAPKIRKNSALSGPDFGGMRGRGSRPDRGGGEAPDHYPNRPHGGSGSPRTRLGWPIWRKAGIRTIRVEANSCRLRADLAPGLTTRPLGGGFAQGRRAKRIFARGNDCRCHCNRLTCAADPCVRGSHYHHEGAIADRGGEVSRPQSWPRLGLTPSLRRAHVRRYVWTVQLPSELCG